MLSRFRGPALILRQAEEVGKGNSLGVYIKVWPLASFLHDGFSGPLSPPSERCAVDGILVNARDEGKVILARAKNRPCGYFRAVLLESEE